MTPRIFFSTILTCFIFILTTNPSSAEPRGRLLGIDSSSKYLIYYGGDFSQQNIDKMKTFDVIVLHPSSNGVTPRIVKELQDAGVSYVLGYISIGEDAPGLGELPITHLGKGPIYKDETTQEIVYQNQGIASFYLDSVYSYESTQYEHDSAPDVNGIFGGYFIYPNSDWHWVLNEMRIGGSPNIFTQRQYIAGLKQIAGQRDTENLDNKFANFGFDGFFLDTLDTAGPYTAKGWYPWVAEPMQKTVKFISDNYPEKVVLANRGSFYYQAGLHNITYNVSPIDFSVRPYINAMLFESYMLDSDESHTGVSPFFLDNHKNVAPKLMTEANRPDGFTITNMDYMMNRSTELYDQLFTTVVKEQGWITYLSLTGYIDTIDLDFPQKLDDQELMADTSPPQWMHTGEYSFQNKLPRVGVQKLKKGAKTGELTVFWDSAKDQSWPIHYNISIATEEDFSDQIKHNHVAFKKNPAWNNHPETNVANKFTLTDLTEGTYYVRVTAEDSSINQLEDNNTTTLSISLAPTISNPITQSPAINGNLDEWQTLQAFGTDSKDIPNASALDWKQAWMAHDDDTLYLAYQYHNPITMSWGHIIYLDTDTDGDTGYRGASNTMPIGVEYMIQGYRLWKYTGSGNDWTWQFISEIGRSWSKDSAEMYLSRASIGHPEHINLYYEGNNASLGLTSIDLFPDTVNSEGKYFSYSLVDN
jgi:hypothetical protein